MSNGSSTCAGTGSPVTTQLCSSAATSRPSARTSSPFRSSVACASSRSSDAGRAARRPRRAQLRRRTRSSRSPSRIWSIRKSMGEALASSEPPSLSAVELGLVEPRPERPQRRRGMVDRPRPARRRGTGFRAPHPPIRAAGVARATARPGRASAPTSLRTVLPSVGSPSPSSRCSRSITAMNRSVSATESRDAVLASPLQPDDDQRRHRRKHREPAVERVRRPALAIPVRAAALRAVTASNSRCRASGRPLIAGTGSRA